jgi:Zn ribbon nucleic-acid-binding protein
MGNKLTNEEYDKKLYEKFKGEYIRLENYINNSTKILHRHNSPKCNYHEWKVIPANLICKIPKAGCPVCGKEKNIQTQRKSLIEIKFQLNKKWNNEYILNENSYKNYKNNTSKLIFKHTICDTEFEMSCYHILNNIKIPCPKCSYKNRNKNVKKINKKEYLKRLPKEFLLIDEYISYDTKILHRHNSPKCNYHEWKVSPHNILNGCGCPECKRIKNSKRNNKENSTFFNKITNDYEIISNYEGSNKNIKIKHKICNNIFTTTPHKFTTCPICYKNYKSNKEFKDEFNKLSNEDYILLSDYINNKTKIKILHKKCNKIYETTPDTFIKGCRCPYCKSSKGEEKIRKWLENQEYDFEEQYSFNDCKYKLPLKFDFKLQDDSGKIILIEYDGIQHYQESFYGNNLKEQQLRDKIKDDYCNLHDNIDLYRIPYTEFDNIENILKSIIKIYE